MVTPATNRVMIELSRRASAKNPSDVNSIGTNRISLLCDTISISTSKSAFPIDIPFSGVISGESATMVMDLGASRKEISLTGIIKEQEITKFKGGKNAVPKVITLTSYEIAQLLHSYVDSSFVHEDQNISKLIILMPSRADNNFDYRTSSGDNPTAHNNITATTPLHELPLIPFHFANRSYDVTSWSYGHTKKTFDYFKNTSDEIEGIRGFVSSFSTDIAGADTPHISFNMTFIQSATLVSDFINTTF
jgi:hypothetical protein